MTIYILDNEPKLCAQYLDDRSLDRMIRDIAQVLCNVHWLQPFDKMNQNIPLKYKNTLGKLNKDGFQVRHTHSSAWSKWASECKANYLYLVELGKVCLSEAELHRRLKNYAKLFNVIYWARDNIPDLHEFITKDKGLQNCFGDKFEYKSYNEISIFPLVMPKKHLKIYPYKMVHIIESYRNYYQAKYLKNCRFRIYDKEHIRHEWKWSSRKKPEWIIL